MLPTSKNLIVSKKKLHKVAKSSTLYSTSKGGKPRKQEEGK
nr:MAG TPA: hypothetical protein [Caudoviricetes sp.]